MEISRRGAARDHGWNSIDLKRVSVHWEAKELCLRICSNDVPDFLDTSAARHNYELSLTLEEFCQLIDVLAAAGTRQSPEQVATHLGPSLRALLRLVANCVGTTGTTDHAS